ncbi:MAG: GH32 C-terminal domain-containing protein [Clostridium paraputrificum]|uniref:GH32 C-terminal domain-containing protein n=1 Tax=Clostridium TaxID=1485 RepID=UPI00189ECF8F|nr:MULTISPECIES: GH32 C-terminal domain-containing protein [Clostridium]MDB2085002.1 GH32 C-terminal domain-containing protein [Clostridium paraputrificum]MDU5739414.1 GH32 C-terminal domain-containing protein [Clostridium sp.]MDU5783881.1 GH32 C-terminal domain-containing protein [Clostridium sp.]
MKKDIYSKKGIKRLIGASVSTTILFTNLSVLPVSASINNMLEGGESEVSLNYESFDTNLEWDSSFKPSGEGEWKLTPEGLRSKSSGDSFMFSNINAKDFVYTANVKFNEAKGAASLVIRSNKSSDNKNSYVVNINGENGEARIFKFENNNGIDVAASKKLEVKSEYNLKVVAIDKHLVFYIDDKLIASTGDYTMQSTDLGQNDAILEGFLGLLTWNSDVTYQDVYYTEINESNTPELQGVEANPVSGKIESKIDVKKNQYVYVNYVSNDCESIVLDPVAKNQNVMTEILDSSGKVVEGNLPLNVGRNIYSIVSKNKDGASVIYNLVIHRRKSEYYNEQYRGQYHYSVKEGWGNDPNGMVYFNNKYHLFYQFYDNGTNWGPMHWGHATSEDLIHWEDQPIAFYPDEYGTMFSGCAVIDKDNQSGLFKDENGEKSKEGGLVAIITSNGNGQRITAAYSKDGSNWEKHDEVLVDWSEDPLNSKDFRDPKVFRYQDKWFMVIAGGPLRIYSSDNLLDWKVESTYGDLHTECPDLYRLPLNNSDGTVEYKWVLSRGGRYYKIGDFKEVDGNWRFIPDKEYSGSGTENDGIMNFGKDSYAAMTYYKNDFDYEDRNGKVDDVIEINWMNTWDDYCNSVDDASGNNVFNGTYNLQLKLGLTRDENGKIVLTQTPISEYETLRNHNNKISLKNATIKPGKNLLKDFSGKSYNIVANIRPEKGTTEVGFNVHTGENGEKTVVKYNFETKEISIDRSKSGASPSNKFLEVMKQSVKENPDGSIDLNLYVDRSSVEVFTKDYTVTGAAQIFSSEISDGLEVFSVGGNAIADIDVYEMNSIWKDRPQENKAIKLSTTNVEMYKKEKYELIYKVEGLDNNKVIVDVENPNVAKVKVNNNKIVIEGLNKGETVLKIRAKDEESIERECKIKVVENNFVTNLSGWKSTAGKWVINDINYECKDSGNAFTFAENKAENDKYTYEVDVNKNNGLVNIIFGAQSTNVWDGCYSVQLVDNKVRLFDFKEDYTFAISDLKESNNSVNKVKIDVDGSNIKVSVDGVEYIDVTVDRVYTKGYFGLGLYNSFGQFSNVKVTGAYNFNKIVTNIDELRVTTDTTLEEIASKLPDNIQLSDVNGNLVYSGVKWDYSNVSIGKKGKYTILGKVGDGLELDVKVIISKAKEEVEPAPNPGDEEKPDINDSNKNDLPNTDNVPQTGDMAAVAATFGALAMFASGAVMVRTKKSKKEE